MWSVGKSHHHVFVQQGLHKLDLSYPDLEVQSGARPIVKFFAILCDSGLGDPCPSDGLRRQVGRFVDSAAMGDVLCRLLVPLASRL